MLTFFTDPHEDELLYGAIARYHYYIGNIDYKDTLRELFGKDSVIPSLYLPCNLEHLAKQLGKKYTLDYLIKNHTLFPFYAPFLPQERKNTLINTMKYEDGQGIYTRLGMIAGSICKKEGIYYCPLCSKKEIKEYGEAYIHRIHQFQGVFVCPMHEAKLKKYKIDKTRASRVAFIRLDEKLLELDTESNERKAIDKELVKIAQAARYLLDNDLSAFDKEIVAKKYRELLYEKGFLSVNKTIQQKKLYDAFVWFYGKQLLKNLESDIDKDDEYNWLKVISRNSKRTVHPIRHILFINFLTEDIKYFFKPKIDFYFPFRQGSWPCLNPVAEHYKKDIIKNIKITSDYKTRLPVGTFSCVCGFVYSRKGPDQFKEDRYRIGRIKAFGHVWENKLKAYLKEEKYGLRELARLMKCDPKTIKKFDEKLGLNYFQGSKTIVKEVMDNENQGRQIDIQAYKDKIINTIREQPSLSRTQIRKLCQKEYSYLYCHEKEWLFLNLPENMDKQEIDCKSDQRVAWDIRDTEIVEGIKEAYKKLLESEKSVRITKSSIGKVLGILPTLENYLDKLPQTKEFLYSILESVTDFQIRRSKRIIDEKIAKGEPIRLWEIQRLAGIRTKAFNKIKDSLEVYINRGG
ncbi:TnsD family Tn7-like transposition protein [Marinisporobacter balticus]|uniref:TniQ protein n=1 Tax=Marinisporobacter balticus TaxID=2018667 RepID=A0A4R2KHB2_9FIRM|nr:TnsD family Tn7-like transposition protein [Marinisporobacter balticus]TCO71812.1 TniQ protein [Marinisporobacter balticus]